jgi:3-dehydroquinate dehydratase-2
VADRDLSESAAVAARILVLNGPNLNMLGAREPTLYGHQTLDDIREMCVSRAEALELDIDFRQSNHEGELVEWIQQARGTCAGIVINPGSYTHTSVAILDALLLSELPIIEVHISNIFRREAFRGHSYVSQAASGMITGLRAHGYVLALDAVAEIITSESQG